VSSSPWHGCAMAACRLRGRVWGIGTGQECSTELPTASCPHDAQEVRHSRGGLSHWPPRACKTDRKKEPLPNGEKKTIYCYENTASATTTPNALTHKQNMRHQHSNKAHIKHSRTSMHRYRHRNDVLRTKKEEEQKNTDRAICSRPVAYTISSVSLLLSSEALELDEEPPPYSANFSMMSESNPSKPPPSDRESSDEETDGGGLLGRCCKRPDGGGVRAGPVVEAAAAAGTDKAAAAAESTAEDLVGPAAADRVVASVRSTVMDSGDDMAAVALFCLVAIARRPRRVNAACLAAASVRAGAAAVGGGRARLAAAPDGAVGGRARDAAAEAADAPAALVVGRPAERLAAAAAGAAVRTDDAGAAAADGAAAVANITEAGLFNDDAGTFPAPSGPEPPADEEVAAAGAVLDAEAAADDARSALSEPDAVDGGDATSVDGGGTSPDVP